MSTEVISAHRNLLDIAEALLDKLEDPAPELRDELSRSKTLEEFDPMTEYRSGRMTNWLLERILRFEVGLISIGVSFPMGGSLFVVARRRD